MDMTCPQRERGDDKRTGPLNVVQENGCSEIYILLDPPFFNEFCCYVIM